MIDVFNLGSSFFISFSSEEETTTTETGQQTGQAGAGGGGGSSSSTITGQAASQKTFVQRDPVNEVKSVSVTFTNLGKEAIFL